jgi:hypothetical protein
MNGVDVGMRALDVLPTLVKLDFLTSTATIIDFLLLVFFSFFLVFCSFFSVFFQKVMKVTLELIKSVVQ